MFGDPTLVGNTITEKIGAITHFRRIGGRSRISCHPLRYDDNNTCKARTLMEAAVTGRAPHFTFSSTPRSSGL
jgi:UDP-glucose 4-epimerase